MSLKLMITRKSLKFELKSGLKADDKVLIVYV